MVNTKMVKSVAEAFINGWTATSTMVSGWMGRNTDMVIGRMFRKTHISGAGRIIWPMGSVFISGPMETGTKANGKNHWGTDTELISFQTETSFMANTDMVKPQGRASINGLTVKHTPATLKRVRKTERECGRSPIMMMIICIRVSTWMIWSMAKESSNGVQVATI